MKLGAALSIMGAIAVIVGVSLGGHIYRWEGIVWPAITIVWVCVALIFWRLSENV